MGVRGAISIKDNMSAVLRSVRQEQSAFRRDVQRTRRELESTWDRRRTARLDATAANRPRSSCSGGYNRYEGESSPPWPLRIWPQKS